MEARKMLARLKKRVQQELAKCDAEMRQTDQSNRRYAWASASTQCELFLAWIDEELDADTKNSVAVVKETVH